MPTSRCTTAAERQALARGPAARVAAAVAEGPDAVAATVTDLEGRFRAGARGFVRWQAGTLEALRAHVSPGTLTRWSTEVAWTVGAVNGVTVDDAATCAADHGARLARILEDGGAPAATEAWDAVEGAHRRRHDAHRDALSLLWDRLHEAGGRPAFEVCLRELAEETLLRWMAVDVTLAPRARIEEWAAVLTSNWAAITIDEHDDGFTLVQDPCGTCTRQLTDGCATALGLGTIAPFAPEHVGTEPVPSYRAHVGLMHWLMPTERTGRPWPEIHCPAGRGTGPCRIDLITSPSEGEEDHRAR